MTDGGSQPMPAPGQANTLGKQHQFPPGQVLFHRFPGWLEPEHSVLRQG